jgi:hypothetical protein
MSDLVEKGVANNGFGVRVGIEGVEGDDPLTGAARAESMGVVPELKPPTTHVQAVLLEQLSCDANEPTPVHDDLLSPDRGVSLGQRQNRRMLFPRLRQSSLLLFTLVR